MYIHKDWLQKIPVYQVGFDWLHIRYNISETLWCIPFINTTTHLYIWMIQSIMAIVCQKRINKWYVGVLSEIEFNQFSILFYIYRPPLSTDTTELDWPNACTSTMSQAWDKMRRAVDTFLVFIKKHPSLILPPGNKMAKWDKIISHSCYYYTNTGLFE